MKTITADDGTQYTLEDRLDDDGQPTGIYYLADVEPVKKTEKHDTYIVSLVNLDIDSVPLLDRSLLITPTTAQKLSEAISALVEFVQGEGNDNGQWVATVSQARESYQESQNN